MTETELEKLVVRLTGDGSSYQKMANDAIEGNKTLARSMKQVEDANKQMDSYMHSSAGQWREHNRAMNETKVLLAEYALHLKSGAQAWTEYKNSARQAISEIRGQMVGLAQTWAASTNIFGSGGSLPSRLLNIANPKSWVEVSSAVTSAVRANMNTVMRDESTFSVGANGFVSVNPKRRWVTAAEAEREDYRKSLIPRYQAIAREERQYRRNLQDEGTAAIENRQERIKAMRTSVTANLNDEFKARKEADMLSKQLENLERNVVGRGSAAVSSVWNWTENPYEANINKVREKRDLARKEVLEAEDRRRKSVRDVEESERAGKKSDEDMLKDQMRRTATVGMTDNESRLYAMRQSGMSNMNVAAMATEMHATDSRRLTKSLEEEETERGYIGKSARQVRDLRTRAKMKREGFDESQIKSQLDSFAKTDKAQDAQNLSDKIKEVVKALREQADAFSHNNDVMRPYESLLTKITDKEQKAAFIADVKAEDKKIRHSQVMQSRPQERYRQAEAHINQLYQENAISENEKNQALSQAKRDIYGTPSGRGYVPSQAIEGVEAGGAEALAHLSSFRELAFGSGPGGGGSSRPTKLSVKQRQAIAKAKAASPQQRMRARMDAAKARSKARRSVRMTTFRALHGYGMGEHDPTAGAVNRMLDNGNMEQEGLGVSVGEASDYWGNMNKDGLDPTKKGLFGDDETSKKSEEHLRSIAEKFNDNNTLVVKLADLK